MPLTIYGTAESRALRPLWVAHELGLDHVHVPTPFLDGTTRTPAFLALNPNGHIPVVDDNGIIVWESMACALYLATRFQSEVREGRPVLAPQDHAEQAEVLRWSFWTVTEVEKDALTLLMHRHLMPAQRRKPELADDAERRLRRPLQVLEQHLQQQARSHVAAERFTVADVCVASVLMWTRGSPLLVDANPTVYAWLARCLARPAFLAVIPPGKKG